MCDRAVIHAGRTYRHVRRKTSHPWGEVFSYIAPLGLQFVIQCCESSVESNAIGRVCRSVRLFPFYFSNQLILDLDFGTFMGHNYIACRGLDVRSIGPGHWLVQSMRAERRPARID